MKTTSTLVLLAALAYSVSAVVGDDCYSCEIAGGDWTVGSPSTCDAAPASPATDIDDCYSTS